MEKPKIMKSCLKGMEIKKLNLDVIDFSNKYNLLYNSDNTPPSPIFYFNGNKYYPVFTFINKNEFENNSEFDAIVFEDRIALVEFVISVKGVTNLKLIDKLLILQFTKDHAFENLYLENLKKYLPLLKLPETALTMLNDNRLSPDLALKLISLPAQDIDEFITFVETFKLSINLQKEVFDYLIAKQKEVNESFGQIITAFVGEKERATKDEIVYKIRKELMPEYMQTLDNFNKLKNKLSLPQKVYLLETPYFEKKNLKLEIFFKSLDEIKGRLSDLKANLEEKKDIWDEIFKII